MVHQMQQHSTISHHHFPQKIVNDDFKSTAKWETGYTGESDIVDFSFFIQFNFYNVRMLEVIKSGGSGMIYTSAEGVFFPPLF